MTNREIGRKIDNVLKHIPLKDLEELPKTRYGLSQWHSYEHFIWKTGEQIRQMLLKNKNIVLSDKQIEKIIEIINNPLAKRGRQTFAWLLGKRKYAGLAPRIIDQIYDDDVSLHIFDTIYKMRALGYEKEILDFQERFKPLAAERKKIKRYLDGFK